MSKPHEPTEEVREMVKNMSGIGLPQGTIGSMLGIDEKTLRKYYRHELDHGASMANAQIGGALFKKAMGGDTAALIFWCKTRMGWSETTKIEHGINKLSDAELVARAAATLGGVATPGAVDSGEPEA